MSERVRRNVELVALAAILAVVIAVAIGGSRLAVYNFTIIALQAMAVISLNLLLGLAGQVSFAQTTFMAVGGYGSALLTLRLGLNPWLALFISAFMSLAVALVVGRPLLRLRGHYLAMATFALALGTYSFVGAATPLTNGSIGISGVPPLALGSLSLDSPLSFYERPCTARGLPRLSSGVTPNSNSGRARRAGATGQDVAAALGVNVTAYKGLAFAIAAVIASLAGSLYVEFTSFVGPDLYDIGMVVNIFLMLFIGGRGSNVGPILGAALLTIAPQYLAGLEQFQNLVFFVFLLVLILVWPAGLFGRARN